jgi:predicted DNA-binding transcriptional regulator YafY
VTDAPSRVERVLNLLSLMLDTRVVRTREEYVREIAGYPEQPDANRRAFERDKEILRGMGVPITMETFGDGGEVGYRVRPEDYCLPDLGLTPDETAALRVAVSAVSLGDHTGHGALMKLGEVGDQTAAPIASLPIAPALATLFDAFRHRAVVNFGYRGETRTLEPWGLSSKRGHWYVVGHDRDRDAPRAFRVDRLDAEPELGPDGGFEPPDAVDPAEYVRADPLTYGEDQPVDAHVLVDAPRAGWVVDQLGEEAVVDRRPDGGIVVSLPVVNRAAFRSWVVDLLDHAEVLSPPELRVDMVAWLDAVAGGRA